MKRVILICFGLLLVACGAETAVSPTNTPLPEPTTPPTPTAEPTNTPVPTPEPTATQTPVPLSQEEIDDLLIESAKMGDLENVKFALAQGADIEATERLQGFTALAVAAFRGHTEIVVYLLSQEANVDALDNKEATPLTQAAKNGHADLVPILVDAGADIEHQDDSQYEMRPLHWAARNDHVAAVAALLDAGANIDGLENTQSTALMYAAYFNSDTDVVTLLIERGADLNLRDNVSKTALYWANNRNQDEIAALIEAAGGTE